MHHDENMFGVSNTINNEDNFNYLLNKDDLDVRGESFEGCFEDLN